jgi:hypothetical protein
VSAGQKWVSHERIELILQPSIPSPWYVLYLCVTENDDDRNVTPLHFASFALCFATHFFRIMVCGYQSLHFYGKPFHRFNEVAAELNRFGYLPLVTQNQNFTRDNYGELLDAYPAKIFYLRTPLDPNQIRMLGETRPSPVIIVDDARFAEDVVKAGLRAVELSNLTTAFLHGEMKRMFESGTSGNPGHPTNFLAANSEGFSFVASPLAQTPEHNLRVTEPNELLLNHLKRAFVPDLRVPQPPKGERPAFLISTVMESFKHRLADRVIVSRFRSGNRALGEQAEKLADVYRENPSSPNFEAVLEICSELLPDNPEVCDYILCCPAINREFPSKAFRKSIPTRVLKYLFRQKEADYQSYIEIADLKSSGDREALVALTQIQALENELLTNMLDLYSLTTCRPVVRTPQLPSAVFTRLRHLRTLYQNHNNAKFNSELEEAGKEFWTLMPAEIASFVQSNRQRSVKLISDLPLEWLTVDGVPLMFQAEVSRIPITPMNALFGHYQSAGADITLSEEHLSNILILNCLSTDDPLYEFPRVMSDTLGAGRVPHRFESVQGVDAYRESLARNRPTILIHFGHGSYDKQNEIGYLEIGKERTDVWNLRPPVMPPIVLLGACETAVLAETHNTPANAFLLLGARTVLATYLPVECDLTVVLYTRVLVNLCDTLTGEGNLKSWQEVVSKTLILNRYLDFVYQFKAHLSEADSAKFPNDIFLEYTYRWNKAEFHDLREGYRKCPDLIFESLSHFSPAIGKKFREFIRHGNPHQHTMFFTPH